MEYLVVLADVHDGNIRQTLQHHICSEDGRILFGAALCAHFPPFAARRAQLHDAPAPFQDLGAATVTGCFLAWSPHTDSDIRPFCPSARFGQKNPGSVFVCSTSVDLSPPFLWPGLFLLPFLGPIATTTVTHSAVLVLLSMLLASALASTLASALAYFDYGLLLSTKEDCNRQVVCQ